MEFVRVSMGARELFPIPLLYYLWWNQGGLGSRAPTNDYRRSSFPHKIGTTVQRRHAPTRTPLLHCVCGGVGGGGSVTLVALNSVSSSSAFYLHMWGHGTSVATLVPPLTAYVKLSCTSWEAKVRQNSLATAIFPRK